MDLYVIRRRNGWANAQELEKAAGVSARVGNEEMPTKVRWIRSYVVKEESGELGTVCLYEATSPEAIREHAARAGLPAHEITPVVNTVIVRDDPVPEAAVA